MKTTAEQSVSYFILCRMHRSSLGRQSLWMVDAQLEFPMQLSTSVFNQYIGNCELAQSRLWHSIVQDYKFEEEEWRALDPWGRWGILNTTGIRPPSVPFLFCTSGGLATCRWHFSDLIIGLVNLVLYFAHPEFVTQPRVNYICHICVIKWHLTHNMWHTICGIM